MKAADYTSEWKQQIIQANYSTSENKK